MNKRNQDKSESSFRKNKADELTDQTVSVVIPIGFVYLVHYLLETAWPALKKRFRKEGQKSSE